MSEVSLKEFMELRFEAIENELARLREAVTGDLVSLKGEQKQFAVKQGELIERLLVVENTLKSYRYIGSLIVGVIMLLVGAWLLQTLGL